MIADLSLQFVNTQSAVYTPGQEIEACLVLDTNEELHVKGFYRVSPAEIYAKFKGQSRTSWTTGTGDNRRYHSETEQYFKTKIPVLGHAPYQEIHVISPGNYSCPLRFTLPYDLPSSFEGEVGHVRYLIKAKVDRKGASDYRVQRPFTVVKMLDLNVTPGARLPSQIQDTKAVCCLCCKAGPVTCSMRIDRRGYVPGESIPVNAEIVNNGTSPILFTNVTLTLTTKFKAYGSKTTRTRDIATISHGRVEPGGSDIWTGELLRVPPTPPSGLDGCSIIDPQYVLKLGSDMRGSLLCVNFELPITIGTRPLMNSTMDTLHSRRYNDIQNTDIGLMTMDGQAGPPITTQPSKLSDPPPSYQECVTTGRARIMRQRSEDKGEESTNFAPSYPYYSKETSI